MTALFHILIASIRGVYSKVHYKVHYKVHQKMHCKLHYKLHWNCTVNTKQEKPSLLGRAFHWLEDFYQRGGKTNAFYLSDSHSNLCSCSNFRSGRLPFPRKVLQWSRLFFARQGRYPDSNGWRCTVPVPQDTFSDY